jgi:virulence-associated protein VapD
MTVDWKMYKQLEILVNIAKDYHHNLYQASADAFHDLLCEMGFPEIAGVHYVSCMSRSKTQCALVSDILIRGEHGLQEIADCLYEKEKRFQT